jgi:hypothetical protein
LTTCQGRTGRPPGRPGGIAEHFAPDQAQAILTQELCQARRRDNLAAAIHMVVEALFWFHPLVWWISSRLLEERERACDERVLELGTDRRVYAETGYRSSRGSAEVRVFCVPARFFFSPSQRSLTCLTPSPILDSNASRVCGDK